MRSQARAIISYRRRQAGLLFVVLVFCVSLVGCSLGPDRSGLDIPGFSTGTTGSSDQANAQAALEYLSPDGELSDGRWVPGEETRQRWETLDEGDWNPAGLEELTAAMAAASTLRTSQDDDNSAAATWVTGRSIDFVVNQLPLENYTDTTKQNLAVLLGNCPDEIADMARGGSLEGVDVYGLSGLVTDAQFETVPYRIIDNETAADTLVATMLEYHHNQIDSKMTTATDPEALLLGQYQFAARSVGYLDGIAELRAGDNTPDTVDEADIDTVLRAQAYVDAAQYGLLSDAAMEAAATGNNGQPFSFYIEIDGQPTITAPDPITPETAHSYINWRTLVNDSVTISIDSDINAGHNLGYASGQAAEVIK